MCLVMYLILKLVFICVYSYINLISEVISITIILIVLFFAILRIHSFNKYLLTIYYVEGLVQENV